MGRYCDICKVSDTEKTIGWIRTDNEWYAWCDFEVEVCIDCAKKIKESIEKIIN